MKRGLFLLILVGCSKTPEQTFSTMEGFQYGWSSFNHRISHLEGAVDTEGGRIAVVGGTSTTGVDEDLPSDSCDPETCAEFPFVDSANIRLDWATATTSAVWVGQGQVELVVGEETTANLEIPVSAKAKGEVFVWVTGFALDTDVPLSVDAESCYRPRNGWIPTRLAFGIGEGSLTEGMVSAEVTANFTAGNSLEEERECLDAVHDQAQIGLTLEAIAVVGEFSKETQDVNGAASFEYGDGPADPDPQPEPTATDSPLELQAENRVLGWTSVDWRFHIDDPEERGAYLRTLALAADPEAGIASGHATNYSPFTQLSGFDYAFSGTLASVDLGGTVTRGRVEETLPAALDDNHDPMVTSVEPGAWAAAE